MTFRFRLETVLQLRRRLADDRRAELRLAMQAETILRERFDANRQELAETQRISRDAGLGRVDVDLRLAARRHQFVLEAQAKELHEQLTKVAAETERRRGALVEAEKQVRVLEKLRERQHEGYVFEELRQEGLTLDEIGLRSDRRSNREAPS